MDQEAQRSSEASPLLSDLTSKGRIPDNILDYTNDIIGESIATNGVLATSLKLIKAH